MTDMQKNMKENIENHKKHNKELCDEYPYLLPHFNNKSDYDDFDYSYIVVDEIPSGWRDLFMQMCEDIKPILEKNNMLDSFYFVQVKEKYGSLRMYVSACPAEVYAILDKYEYVSQFVCECCGQPATKETRGWISHYCDNCFNWRCWDLDDNKYEEIEFEPIMKYERCDAQGNDFEVSVDCNNVWRRLYNEN